MVASAAMRTAALLALTALAAAGADAQTIRVAPPTEVARESDPHRFSEPHLAIHPANPDHLLAGVMVKSTMAGPLQEQLAASRCATFVSHDAGRSWARHDFPFEECGDVQVAILPDGQAMVAMLARYPGVRPDRSDWLIVFHSPNGGVAWDREPALVGVSHDHDAVAVDLTSAKRKGWIYITSHHTVRDGDGRSRRLVWVARSRDGGKTFDEPFMTYPNNLANIAEMPVVLSDGTVVASFVDASAPAPDDRSYGFERRRAWILRSSDGATTFSPPLFVTDACGPPAGFQLSALAVDASSGPFRDRLYFACHQRAGGPIVVATSADRGDTWAAPIAVGPASVDATARRVPTLAVNSAGVLGVLVAERRTVSGDRCLEFSFSASFDGGKTVSAPQSLSESSCGATPEDALAMRQFPTYGDYFGLVSTPDGRFRALWPEMRDGRSVLLTTTITAAAR
jgi:BNR repeat protein